MGVFQGLAGPRYNTLSPLLSSQTSTDLMCLTFISANTSLDTVLKNSTVYTISNKVKHELRGSAGARLQDLEPIESGSEFRQVILLADMANDQVL